jgi:hypothetical protein
MVMMMMMMMMMSKRSIPKNGALVFSPFNNNRFTTGGGVLLWRGQFSQTDLRSQKS